MYVHLSEAKHKKINILLRGKHSSNSFSGFRKYFMKSDFRKDSRKSLRKLDKGWRKNDEKNQDNHPFSIVIGQL
jgi:hypothetical protein